MAFDVSGAIVADDGIGLALSDQQPIEFAGDPRAGDRRIGDQCQALARAVVDHDQNAHAAAVNELIGAKSSDQRSLGHCGTSIGARVPKARLRPPAGGP